MANQPRSDDSGNHEKKKSETVIPLPWYVATRCCTAHVTGGSLMLGTTPPILVVNPSLELPSQSGGLANNYFP